MPASFCGNRCFAKKKRPESHMASDLPDGSEEMRAVWFYPVSRERLFPFYAVSARRIGYPPWADCKLFSVFCLFDGLNTRRDIRAAMLFAGTPYHPRVTYGFWFSWRQEFLQTCRSRQKGHPPEADARNIWSRVTPGLSTAYPLLSSQQNSSYLT